MREKTLDSVRQACLRIVNAKIPSRSEVKELIRGLNAMDKMTDEEIITFNYSLIEEQMSFFKEKVKVPDDKDGFIYLVKCSGKFKIGKSTNMEKRFPKYVTENPEEVELVGYFKVKGYSKVESLIHKEFRNKRIDLKREWFSLNNDDISKLKIIVKNNEI